jgi:excisionase family DNA binding protein
MSALNPSTQPLSDKPTLQVIDNHITVQEASEITGYNVQYLRRLLRAEKLDAIKVGQIWLINLASLQAYINLAISSNDLRCGPKSPWQPPF